MSNSLRIIGVILIACFTMIGLLSIFEVIPSDSIPKSAGQLALGAAGLVAAILAVKVTTSGRPNVNDTEPPPSL